LVDSTNLYTQYEIDSVI